MSILRYYFAMVTAMLVVAVMAFGPVTQADACALLSSSITQEPGFWAQTPEGYSSPYITESTVIDGQVWSKFEPLTAEQQEQILQELVVLAPPVSGETVFVIGPYKWKNSSMAHPVNVSKTMYRGQGETENAFDTRCLAAAAHFTALFPPYE